MPDQEKQESTLTPDEQRLAALSADVRKLCAEITRSAQRLSDSINADARGVVLDIVRLSGALAGAVHEREARLAVVQRGRGMPITVVGPVIRWCDAQVWGVGDRSGDVVSCNRMLRDDGTCSHSALHISHYPIKPGDCPGFHNGGVGRTCIRCGVGNTEHFGQADEVAVSERGTVHRHVEHFGLTGGLCDAALRDDGTCSAYPTGDVESPHPRRRALCRKWARHPSGRTMRCNTEKWMDSRCPNAGNHTGAPVLFENSAAETARVAYDAAPKCRARSRRWTTYGATCNAPLNDDRSCPEAHAHV